MRCCKCPSEVWVHNSMIESDARVLFWRVLNVLTAVEFNALIEVCLKRPPAPLHPFHTSVFLCAYKFFCLDLSVRQVSVALVYMSNSTEVNLIKFSVSENMEYFQK